MKPLYIKASIFLVIGCVLISPAFYNPNAFDNILGYIVVGTGIAFIALAIARLFNKPQTEVTARLPPPQTADHNSRSLMETASQLEQSNLLGTFFSFFGHITLVLTALSTAYLIFFAKSGGLSGVPIAFGVLTAGVFYGLSFLAKR
jgi:hypothetical protein